VQAADAPSTGSYCHIDLVHNSAALNFDLLSPNKRPDTFGPFVRVTNSYNSLRALVFDIGFHRKVCKNGLILPESVIRFSFSHSHGALGSGVHFDIAHDRLVALTARFTQSLAGLHKCVVPQELFVPLVCAVLALHEPAPSKRARLADAAQWSALCDSIQSLGRRYAGELGSNAYAVLNTITDFASQPPENRCVRRDRHTLQRLAGVWLSNFSVECQKSNFDVAKYTAHLSTTAPAQSIVR
jgi:hypothetical protein